MTSVRSLIAIGALAMCVTAEELPRRGAIGLVITVKNGSVVVQQVVAGGASEAAGFRVEDEIREVDGERTFSDRLEPFPTPTCKQSPTSAWASSGGTQIFPCS